MKISPVILCGGSGTRLWPLSRQEFPKQFLKLSEQHSLFQQSLIRATSLESQEIEIKEILIVTNENHRFLVLDQLQELDLTSSIRIILEPESKNTAPALTLAAIASSQSDANSILVVTPADHFIKNLNNFILTTQMAIKAVGDKTIFTLGIQPTRPDTAFGYIEYEGNDVIKDVISFKEKPDLKCATDMISQGKHAWNAGMFILKAGTWISAISEVMPHMLKGIENAWSNKLIDDLFERPDKIQFSKIEPESIDYAVMERINQLDVRGRLILLDAGWSDLGSFDAFNHIIDENKDGNIFQGDIVAKNTKNTLAYSTKKNITLLGVKNLIVVETPDCVLVANKDDVQSIKQLTEVLQKSHPDLLRRHRREIRPWGWYEILELAESYKVKRIQINPGKMISLQKHQHRSEHWVVVKGEAMVCKAGKEFLLRTNQSAYIEKNEIHRLSNQTAKILQIIEVQSGEYLGEDDILRIEDNYGR